MKHTCKAIIIHCMDFRFQNYLDEWIGKRFAPKTYDRVSLGGAIYDFYTILKQVEISNNLHEIKKVILVNHEDCGACGEAGNYQRHKHDLLEAAQKIETLFPHLTVETYYLDMNGLFEKISKSETKTK